MKSGSGERSRKPAWWGQAGCCVPGAEPLAPAPCDFPGMLLGEAGDSLVDAPQFKLSFT